MEEGKTLGNVKQPGQPPPAGAPPRPASQRAGYVLMQYRVTGHKPAGQGFQVGMGVCLPLAPVPTLGLFRVSPLVLYLTQEEAAALHEALEVEGCPHLMPADTEEGKPL
jgi:hypothetical protein